MARTINVGILIDEERVPLELRGCRIYYSPEQERFALVDVNGKTKEFFDFDYYQQFLDIDVIDFNGNVKSYMDKALDNYLATHEPLEEDVYEEEAGTDDDYEYYDAEEYYDNDDGYYYEEDAVEYYEEDEDPDTKYRSAIEASMRSEDLAALESEKDQKGKKGKSKDPTRHLLSFFIICLIVTAAIIIARIFALPIIQQLTGLVQ